MILSVVLFLQIPGSCLVDPGALHSASCTPYTIQTGRNSPTVSHRFCRAVFLFRHFIRYTDFFRHANDNGFLVGIPCTWTGFGRSSCAAFSCVVALSSSGSTRSVPATAATATSCSGFHEVYGKQPLYGFCWITKHTFFWCDSPPPPKNFIPKHYHHLITDNAWILLLFLFYREH